MYLDIIHRLTLSKNTVLFIFQNVSDWILSPPSGKTYSVGPKPEKGTSSIDWAQLSKFYLKAETESSLRNVVFSKINGMVFWIKSGQ
jgi:hypothetical protein